MTLYDTFSETQFFTFLAVRQQNMLVSFFSKDNMYPLLGFLYFKIKKKCRIIYQ